MAIIGKIQKRTGLLIIVILVGLGLFLIQGALEGLKSFVDSDRNHVGQIADQTITRKEYQDYFDLQKGLNEVLSGQPVTRDRDPQFHRQAWDYFFFQTAFQQEFEELGITLTLGEEGEEVDMVQGSTVDPMITSNQNFFNPQTQQFDPNNVRQLLNMLKMEPQNMDEARRLQQVSAFWQQLKQQLMIQRPRNKYVDLLEKSAYVTKAEAERDYYTKNTKGTFNYLYVPYTSLADSTVELGDPQLKEYLAENKKKYKVEDTRTISYVKFDVLPSKADTVEALDLVNDVKKLLAEGNEDSSVVISRSESERPISSYTYDRLPFLLKQELKPDSTVLQVGAVFGPFNQVSAGKFQLFSVLGHLPNDTVYQASASHVLIMPDTSGGIDSAQAAALALQEANTVLEKALADENFAALAREYSDDPGSAQNGGSYRDFPTGQMVKPFESAVFDAKELGVVPRLIETDFGYHIIKVDKLKEQKAPEWIIGSVDVGIRPSSDTENDVFVEASTFLGRVKSGIAAMEKAVEEDSSLTLEEYPGVRPVDYSIPVIGDARSAIYWAFDAETEVGDVYKELVQTENSVVVVALKRQSEKGNPTLEDVRGQLEQDYRNSIKANRIIAMLDKLEGELGERTDALNKENGPNFAKKNEAEAKLSENAVYGIYEPRMMGTAFGLSPDAWSSPMTGDNGVFIVQTKKIEDAEEPADGDYTSSMEGLKNSRKATVGRKVDPALREMVEVIDHRYKL